MEGGGRIEDSTTFAVVGATIVDNFDLKIPEGTIGSSFLKQLI
jgi:phosphopentomutase